MLFAIVFCCFFFPAKNSNEREKEKTDIKEQKTTREAAIRLV